MQKNARARISEDKLGWVAPGKVLIFVTGPWKYCFFGTDRSRNYSCPWVFWAIQSWLAIFHWTCARISGGDFLHTSLVILTCWFLAPYGGGNFLHTSLVILTFWSRGGVSRGRIWVQTIILITFERRRKNRSRGGLRVAGNGQIAAKTRCSKNVIKPMLFWWFWCVRGAKRWQS